MNGLCTHFLCVQDLVLSYLSCVTLTKSLYFHFQNVNSTHITIMWDCDEVCFCCLIIKSYLNLSDPLECSTPGLPVLHYPLKFAQIHVHWVSDTIQLSHPLSTPSPLALNLSQYQGLFQWVNCSHQVAKVLEFQVQHQSYQWIFRVNFLWLTGLISL